MTCCQISLLFSKISFQADCARLPRLGTWDQEDPGKHCPGEHHSSRTEQSDLTASVPGAAQGSITGLGDEGAVCKLPLEVASLSSDCLDLHVLFLLYCTQMFANTWLGLLR